MCNFSQSVIHKGKMEQLFSNVEVLMKKLSFVETVSLPELTSEQVAACKEHFNIEE